MPSKHLLVSVFFLHFFKKQIYDKSIITDPNNSFCQPNHQSQNPLSQSLWQPNHNQLTDQWPVSDHTLSPISTKSPQPEFVTDHIEHFHNSDLSDLFPCKCIQSFSNDWNSNKSDRVDNIQTQVISFPASVSNHCHMIAMVTKVTK